MPFPRVLRIAATLIFIVALTELVVLEELIIPPFFVATLLFTLSFVFNHRPQLTKKIAIAVAFLIPPLAVAGYLLGLVVIAVPIFDTLLFSWVLWTALNLITFDKETNRAHELSE